MRHSIGPLLTGLLSEAVQRCPLAATACGARLELITSTIAWSVKPLSSAGRRSTGRGRWLIVDHVAIAWNEACVVLIWHGK
jgi:hypothetical protein